MSKIPLAGRLALLSGLAVSLGACSVGREARPDAAGDPTGDPTGLAVFHDPGDRFSIAYPAGWSAAQLYEFVSFSAISPELAAMEGGGFVSLEVESFSPPWTAADRALAADSNARAESEAEGDGPRRLRVASFGQARLGALPAFRLVVTGDESLGRGGPWHVTTYVADAPDGSGQVVLECGDESHDPSLCDRIATTFRFGPAR